MIARTFYVLLYLTVSIGSAWYLTNNSTDWNTWSSGLKQTSVKFYHGLTTVMGKLGDKISSNSDHKPLDDTASPEKIAPSHKPDQAPGKTLKRAMEKFMEKFAGNPFEKTVGKPNGQSEIDRGDGLLVPEPQFDREGLELLVAQVQDFETELEFIVPKPVRARRPRNLDIHLPTRAPIEYLKVPRPKLAMRPKRLKRPSVKKPYITTRSRTQLVALENAPFPYSGNIGNSRRPFLNVSKDGRRGHKTRSGRLYWADTTYSEKRSLLHVPKGFDAEKPGVMVVFFHGWGAKLERDIWRRQRLPQQITASGANAVLVAPQFGVNARDSSIGNFWRPGALREYLNEAAVELAKLSGKPTSVDAFLHMPIVLVGYSGGYVPTAFALARGGISDRVLGVVLLDALYGQLGTFSKWIKRSRHTFFVSAHMSSTRKGNNRLRSVMKKAGIPYEDNLTGQLQPGSVKIIHAPARHRSYVTQAWAPDPVADILRKIPGLPQRGNQTQRLSLR